MTRSERLLKLLEILSQYRHPVKAADLSDQLSVSLRTIYRDIESLRRQGANITGETGIGYVLKEGLFLPPLMFSIEEVEALVLGSQWVKSHADQALRNAANQAMQKITTVIPSKYQQQIKNNTLFTPLMDQSVDIDRLELSATKVRQAIREEKVLTIDYQDGDGEVSQRIIYAFSLAFFDSVQVIGAWCELRKDFRHFRVDRILNIKILNQRYHPTRASLLSLWRAKHHCDLIDD